MSELGQVVRYEHVVAPATNGAEGVDDPDGGVAGEQQQTIEIVVHPPTEVAAAAELVPVPGSDASLQQQLAPIQQVVVQEVPAPPQLQPPSSGDPGVSNNVVIESVGETVEASKKEKPRSTRPLKKVQNSFGSSRLVQLLQSFDLLVRSHR